MDKAKIIKLIEGQARSADLWIAQWERYKDLGGVRNAAMAIGKLFGLYNVLFTMCGETGEDAPDELIAMMQKYQDVWDNLSLGSGACI